MFDVGQHQFLVLLFVMQTDFQDRKFIFGPACSEKSIKLQDQVWTRLLK